MTDPALRALALELAEVRAEVAAIRRGAATPQLVHSSIDGGTLETRTEDGTEVTSSWGEQDDGTTAPIYAPGPVPPAPTAPTSQSLGAAVLIGWDGRFAADAARTADFRLAEVWTAPAATNDFTAAVKSCSLFDTEGDGAEVVLSAEDGPIRVWLVAVTLSGVRSAPSAPVLATPGPVVAEDLLDGIVAPDHLTPVFRSTLEAQAAQAAAAVTAAQAAQTAAQAAQATADGAIRTFYQADPPTGLNNSTHLGDLWYDTDNGQAYRWSGSAWVLIRDNAIAQALAAAQSAQSTADGKIDSFYSGTAPTAGAVGDLWFDTANGNRVSWWTGSSWQAMPAGTNAIANNSITTAKIVTRSVTAVLIAVNNILAEHLAAGSVTAAKLEAQLALVSRLISGLVGGARVEIGPDGITQYADDGQPVVAIGANPDGNYFATRGHAKLVRRNLCPNPRLANNTTGWSAAQGVTGARVAGARVGTAWCHRLTDSGAVALSAGMPPGVLPEGVRVVTVSFVVNPSVAVTLFPNVYWRNSSGANVILASGQGPGVACSANTVTRLSITAPVPDLSYTAVPQLTGPDLPSGAYIDVTAVLIEPSNILADFFDGSSVVGASANNLPNPGFETDTTGWYASYATPARTTARFRSGIACAVITDNPDDTSNVNYFTSTYRMPVSEGDGVTASAWMAHATSGQTGRVQIDWFDANGSAVSPSATASTALAATGWTQITATATVPPGAVACRLSLGLLNPPSGGFWYLDDCLLSTGKVAAWDGTAGNSTSTLNTETADSVGLAALDGAGGLAVQRLAVEDPEPIIGGVALSDRIDTGPGRIVARKVLAASSAQSPQTTSEVGWGDLAFVAEQGRIYKIAATAMTARGGDIGIRVHYTVDGTDPTISSPWLSTSAVLQNASAPFSVPYSFGRNSVKLLLTVIKFSGSGNVYAQAPNGDAGAQFWVEDGGPDSVSTAVWTNSWTRCFDQVVRSSGAARFRTDTMMVQGYSTLPDSRHNATQIGFDYQSIQSTLAGKAIDQVSIYLYAKYWYNSSGGVVILGSHNSAAPPSSWVNITGIDLKSQGMLKSQGLWIDLPVSVGEALRDGTSKGITLDSMTYGEGWNKFVGQFRGHGEDGQPLLRIRYR